MGGGSISSSSMKSYYEERSYISTSNRASQVFRSVYMPDEFNPAKIKLPREARDSAASPHSRGVIFAEDLTGSMDAFLLSLIKDEFPRLITKTYESVSFNPHIMFMGIGDVEVGDRAPLQVTQFETDVRMLHQLEKIYIERGGGCNPYESYILAWYFAAKHISMDCFEKRGEKGFLFTFGDEYPTPSLAKDDIRRVFGTNSELGQRIITNSELYEMASEKFHCYHVVLHGGNYSYDVLRKWHELMGDHVCDLSDHHLLPELVTTIFKMHDGYSKTNALSSIASSSERYLVKEALDMLPENIEPDAGSTFDKDRKIELF